MSEAEKQCPECAERIKKDARICRHCGYRYTAEQMRAQKKQEEKDAEQTALGCLGVIVVGLLIWGVVELSSCISEEDKPPPPPIAVEPINESAAANEALPVAPPRKTESAMSKEEAGEGIATIINLNGHLCAKVTAVNELRMKPDVYEVTCIEYRGGKGTVDYVVDANTGVAYRR